MASLLLAAPNAHAGSYSSPVYSGGTYHGRGGPNGAEGDYNDTLGTSGWGGSGNSVTSASAAGTINATFTWQTTQNEPPPPSGSVIITETSTAGAGVRTPPGGSCQATCDDGFGLPGSKQSASGTPQYSPPPNPVLTGYAASVQAADTRYTVKGGATISLSASPSATAGISSSYSTNASVSYTASIPPVTISIGGTNNPLAGDNRVLTGQQITATLQGLSGFTVTNYTWAVGGSTFKTYNETATSNQLVPLGSKELTGPATGSSAVAPLAFYDRAQENLTVTCTATVLAPDGKTILNVTATSPQINVLKPTVTHWDIAEGYVQYDPNYAPQGQNTVLQTYGLYGNLSGTGNSVAGMAWSNVTFNVPAPFSGNGQCTFTQLVNPNRLEYIGNNSTPTAPNNGILGLDGSFDYGSRWSATAVGGDVDSPAISVGTAGSPQQNPKGDTQLSVSDAFTTYVMYQPSGGVWVPLEKISWSWSEVLNWQTSQWSITASCPNTAGQAGTPAHVPINDPPQWTVVH